MIVTWVSVECRQLNRSSLHSLSLIRCADKGVLRKRSCLALVAPCALDMLNHIGRQRTVALGLEPMGWERNSSRIW